MPEPTTYTVEDVLKNELFREMHLDTRTYTILDDWDTVMHSVPQLPIEYAGYTKRVLEMQTLREMVDLLANGDFDDVRRSESRRSQLRQFPKTLHMYYNLIFTRHGKKLGFGTLIHFPELRTPPERSAGIALVARAEQANNHHDLTFERGKFDDFLFEVKPYIELLGDLYRRTKPT